MGIVIHKPAHPKGDHEYDGEHLHADHYALFGGGFETLPHVLIRKTVIRHDIARHERPEEIGVC